MVKEHHRLSGYEFEQLQGIVKDMEAWYAAVLEVAVGHNLPTKQQQQQVRHKSDNSLVRFQVVYLARLDNGEGNGTPLVLLPGNSRRRRSLVGYSLWGR